MPCKYNPLKPTKTIPYPKEWCNLRWGYCQWAKEDDYYITYCPLHGINPNWLDYWVSVQKDSDKVVLVQFTPESEPIEMTVTQLKNAFTPGMNIAGMNIQYDGEAPEPEPPVKDLSKLLKIAMK